MIIICAALVMSIIIGIYALFRSESSKKNYFLLLQAMIVVYLFGYFIEITSTNIGEAYAGAKVLYTGASFIVTFVFFFIADYCDFKLHRYLVKVPMLMVSMLAAVTLWITKFDRLVYLDYSYNTSLAHHLNFTPGLLYYLLHSYPIICMLLSMAILLFRMKKWKEKYRKHLIILLICLIFPLTTEVIYFTTVFSGINANHIYLTPYSMALMSLCLYMGVARFNIFDVISMTTVSAMEYIRDGFVLLDDGNNYLFSNPVAGELLPAIKKLAKGESILSVKDWPEEFCGIQTDSIEFSTEKGARHFKGSVSPVLARNQTLIAKIVLFHDITDRVILVKKLEDAAYIDALTGIYNRKHFSELAQVNIERALRFNNSIYMAMLDLDFFKRVNDTHGHAAGDQVLMNTAEVIRHTIRSYDLLGRYGGEEFVLLITDLNINEANFIMERIRENIENSVINYEGVEIRITCSIGLAQFTSGDTMETCVKKSDEALYVAKNSGRNQVRIYGESLT
ncbi:MAG: diguanylate cyclase [Treponema sp.]|nr:diguanylate cyclase [Treponema sp.]